MLLREDFNTRTWERFEALLRRRLQKHREQNDGLLDEITTAKTRGRIAEIKELLALADERAPATSGGGSALDAFPQP